MKTKRTYHLKVQHIKPARLTCEEIAKHICTQLDEQINSDKCRQIKKHLEACPNCSIFLDSLKKTVKMYRTYPNPKLSDKCRKELFTKLKL